MHKELLKSNVARSVQISQACVFLRGFVKQTRHISRTKGAVSNEQIIFSLIKYIWSFFPNKIHLKILLVYQSCYLCHFSCLVVANWSTMDHVTSHWVQLHWSWIIKKKKKQKCKHQVLLLASKGLFLDVPCCSMFSNYSGRNPLQMKGRSLSNGCNSPCCDLKHFHFITFAVLLSLFSTTPTE